MASYAYVCASDSYIDGSADENSDNNFFATSGSVIRIATPRTIVNSNDPGLVGEICYDSSYVYVCVDANTWKRSALSTW
jgi:hypothetical protein